jgi:hypothetical protein
MNPGGRETLTGSPFPNPAQMPRCPINSAELKKFQRWLGDGCRKLLVGYAWQFYTGISYRITAVLGTDKSEEWVCCGPDDSHHGHI